MSKKKSGKKSQKKHTNKKSPRRQNGQGAARTPEIRLSQCMIVKNEEKNIEKALTWGRDIVCEQIVVDTGSADRTVEIAESMGAMVLHFEWIDDFAAAKNFAIEHASGNWIAFLDADEYCQPEDTDKIISMLQQIHSDKRIDFVRASMAHTNADGTVNSVSPQDRFFRNDPDLRYRYHIHEQLFHNKKERLGCFDAQEGLLIVHTGYSEEVNRPEKGRRNAQLLEKDMEADPTDAMRLMYLADAYNMADLEEKALECYRKALWDPQMKAEFDVAYLRAGLQILRIRSGKPAEEIEEEFIKVAEELKRRCGDEHPDIDYHLGILYMKKQKLGKAAGYFEAALKKLERYKGAEVSRMAGNVAMPNSIVAAAALNDKNPQKAVQFSVAALQANKFYADGLRTLLLAFMTECRPGMSADPYWSFLYKLYDMSNPKDQLFIWKMAQDAGFQAMTEKAYSVLPPEVKAHIEGAGK